MSGQETQIQKPNPFALAHNGNGKTEGAGAAIEAMRAVTETQAAVVMAREFPRNKLLAYDRILNECARPGLADVAVYAYAKGGSRISGPSIRLAEAIARNWGNMQFGWRELSQKPGASEIETYAWDMETNTRASRQFVISHIRYTGGNRIFLTDPREIYENNANQSARRLRACILELIPGDVVDDAVEECQKTLAAKTDASSDAVKKMIEVFARYGVTTQMIEKRIQCRMDAITPRQMLHLKTVLNSLKDGYGGVGDFFEMPQQSSGDNGTPAPSSRTQAVKERLKGAQEGTAISPMRPSDIPSEERAPEDDPVVDLDEGPREDDRPSANPGPGEGYSNVTCEYCRYEKKMTYLTEEDLAAWGSNDPKLCAGHKAIWQEEQGQGGLGLDVPPSKASEELVGAASDRAPRAGARK